MAPVLISLLPLLLIAVGYIVGSMVERRHLKQLSGREQQVAGLMVTNLKTVPDPATVRSAVLVLGEAVIATDYFKLVASQLRRLIGGEIRSLQSLVDRARREATCRMLEQAAALGACEVHSVRFETSNIRSAAGAAKSISVEMLAFGTAIIRQADAHESRSVHRT